MVAVSGAPGTSAASLPIRGSDFNSTRCEWRAADSGSRRQRARLRRTCGRQRPNAHAVLLEDREYAGPICPSRQLRHGTPCRCFRRRRPKAKQHDSTAAGQARMKRQLAEILVKRQQDSFFALCALENVVVALSGHVGPRPEDVVAGGTRRDHGRPREILVRQEKHDSRRCLIDALAVQQLHGVVQTGGNVVARQTGIAL